MRGKALAAAVAVAALAGPAQAQLGGLFEVFATQTGPKAKDESIQPGRKQLISEKRPDRGAFIDLAPGLKMDVGFAERVTFRFAATAGRTVTIDADAADTYARIAVWPEKILLVSVTAESPKPVDGGPKTARLNFTPQTNGIYRISVFGFPTKADGRIDRNRYVEAGRYSVSMTDAANPTAKPLGQAAAAAKTAPAAPPPPAVPTVATLAREFASKCAQITPANEESCARLRDDLNDAMAGRLKPVAAAPRNGPLGIRVAEGAGGQVRAEVVAVDAGGPAEAAGLKPGDAILYARAADGARTFFGDQASLDAWAAKAAGQPHELAVIRAGAQSVEMVAIRP